MNAIMVVGDIYNGQDALFGQSLIFSWTQSMDKNKTKSALYNLVDILCDVCHCTLRGKGKLQSWSESIRSEYETGFSELMSLECIDNFSSESAQLCLQKWQKRLC